MCPTVETVLQACQRTWCDVPAATAAALQVLYIPETPASRPCLTAAPFNGRRAHWGSRTRSTRALPATAPALSWPVLVVFPSPLHTRPAAPPACCKQGRAQQSAAVPLILPARWPLALPLARPTCFCCCFCCRRRRLQLPPAGCRLQQDAAGPRCRHGVGRDAAAAVVRAAVQHVRGRGRGTAEGELRQGAGGTGQRGSRGVGGGGQRQLRLRLEN